MTLDIYTISKIPIRNHSTVCISGVQIGQLLFQLWQQTMNQKINTYSSILPTLAPLLPHRGCSPQTEEPREEALQPAQEEPALLHHTRNCPHSAHWSPPWKGENSLTHF